MTHPHGNREARAPFLRLAGLLSIRENKRIHDVSARKASPGGGDIAGQPPALIEKIQGKHQVVASMTVHSVDLLYVISISCLSWGMVGENAGIPH
jgi:hypothetical protein